MGWTEIRSISYANVGKVRNAPPGFRDWALANGAVEGAAPMDAEVERGFSTEWRVV